MPLLQKPKEKKATCSVAVFVCSGHVLLSTTLHMDACCHALPNARESERERERERARAIERERESARDRDR